MREGKTMGEHDVQISVVPKEVFRIGSFVVTETMISAAIAVAVIILFALFVRLFCIPKWRKEDEKKSGLRILVEYLVNMFDGNAAEQTHGNSGFTGALYFACAALICIGTLTEMLNLRPPTSDLSLTLTLGILSFLIIFVLGIKEKRAKRLLHYVNPLNLLTDCVVQFSLALRMFGSVFSGYLIMHLIYTLLPMWLHVAVPAIGNVIFTLFHAVIQSYIFMFLSMSLINEAIE